MPKPRGWISIDIRRETRDMLKRFSQELGTTYDETIRAALGALEIALRISRCRAEYDEIVDDVILRCGDEEISIDVREYRRLRRIIKILPKPRKEEKSEKMF